MKHKNSLYLAGGILVVIALFLVYTTYTSVPTQTFYYGHENDELSLVELTVNPSSGLPEQTFVSRSKTNTFKPGEPITVLETIQKSVIITPYEAAKVSSVYLILTKEPSPLIPKLDSAGKPIASNSDTFRVFEVSLPLIQSCRAIKTSNCAFTLKFNAPKAQGRYRVSELLIKNLKNDFDIIEDEEENHYTFDVVSPPKSCTGGYWTNTTIIQPVASWKTSVNSIGQKTFLKCDGTADKVEVVVQCKNGYLYGASSSSKGSITGTQAQADQFVGKKATPCFAAPVPIKITTPTPTQPEGCVNGQIQDANGVCISKCEGTFSIKENKCVALDDKTDSTTKTDDKTDGGVDKIDDTDLTNGNKGIAPLKICPSYFEPNENNTCTPTDDGLLIIIAGVLIIGALGVAIMRRP